MVISHPPLLDLVGRTVTVVLIRVVEAIAGAKKQTQQNKYRRHSQQNGLYANHSIHSSRLAIVKSASSGTQCIADHWRGRADFLSSK